MAGWKVLTWTKKNNMKNLLLFIIAFVLFVVVVPFALIFTALDTAFDLLGDLAKSIDMAGNVLLRKPMNMWLKKEDGYNFGNPKETISYVLGMNELYHKLTGAGRGLCWILNLIDNNHCQKAIKNNS